jgi:peptidoglycan-N-acetylglucosamine deacetylase
MTSAALIWDTDQAMFNLTLSFDNGPEPEVTPVVLDILARWGVRTTFFVIGQKLEDQQRRVIAERAHAEGHWIGNHSYTHSLPLGLQRDPDTAEREIGRTQALLGTLAHPKKLFRPFGGGGRLGHHLLSERVVAFLERGRYTCVLWNAIPHDWDDPDGWVTRAVAQCREKPWTLMVLHDLPTGAMRHLEAFLDAVRGAGGHIRQDFPPDCVPLADGKTVRPLDSYVASAA